MKNKLLINKIKNAAELAWAAYGYYDLMTSDTNQLFVVLKDEKGKDRIDSNGNPITKQVELANVLDITYKNYEVYKPSPLPTLKPEKIGTLNGDFTPTQTKNFFECYELLEHQPNTTSGFSATLFKDLGEVDEKTNTRAADKDSQYILSFRGTEFKLEQIQDLLNDYYIGTNNSDMNRVIEQYFDMLLFYEETLKPLLQEKGITKINVIGHSLGGYLAQWALIYCDSLYKDKLKFSPSEVYTFNAPLESMGVA